MAETAMGDQGSGTRAQLTARAFRPGAPAVPVVPLLAFDTSTEHMAVAACGPRGEVAMDLPGGAAASAQLLPQIQAALQQAGIGLQELAAIAFGMGPGAFTGLRTSCAVAQGLGFGLARPLLPLDSLLAVAEDAWASTFQCSMKRALPATPGRAARIAVAMDARMDEIYGAVYEHAFASVADGSGAPVADDVAAATGAQVAAGPWRIVRAPALYSLAAWNEVLGEEANGLRGLAGSALAAFGARLRLPPGVPAQAREQGRAAALLRLAQQAWAAGAAVDAALALPLYLRDKVALTTTERAAVKAAAALPADLRGAEASAAPGGPARAGSAA